MYGNLPAHRRNASVLLSYITSISNCLCVCMSVSLLYAQLQLSVDLDKICHVASLSSGWSRRGFAKGPRDSNAVAAANFSILFREIDAVKEIR